ACAATAEAAGASAPGVADYTATGARAAAYDIRCTAARSLAAAAGCTAARAPARPQTSPRTPGARTFTAGTQILATPVDIAAHAAGARQALSGAVARAPARPFTGSGPPPPH